MRQGKRIRRRKHCGWIAGLLLLPLCAFALWRLWPADSAALEQPAPPAAVDEPPEQTPEQTPLPDPAPMPEPLPEQTPESPAEYDYSQPVPESDAVDDSWFDDAIFIGNSRTEGFALYSGLGNCKAYTRRGIMVDTLFTEAAINVNGTKVPIMDAVAADPSFKKVYVMMGMNEMGWPDVSRFAEKYALVVERLREIAPDAQIYIQSILPVTQEKSDTDAMYNNPNISKFNAAIKQMAENEEAYYLDVASAVSDENGCLPPDEAFDGLHLKSDGCKLWLQYLKTHTVQEEP